MTKSKFVKYQPIFYWKKPRCKTVTKCSSAFVFDTRQEAEDYANDLYNNDLRKHGDYKFRNVELIHDFDVEEIFNLSYKVYEQFKQKGGDLSQIF